MIAETHPKAAPRAILKRAKKLGAKACDALGRVRVAMQVPQPASIQDVLVDPGRTTFGAYCCEVRTRRAFTKDAWAHLERDIRNFRQEASQTHPSASTVVSRRLTSLVEVCTKALDHPDSDAYVMVHGPDAQLAAFAFVSNAGFALELDYLGSRPSCLLGARPLGPTAGEAALGACVMLSMRCGTGGALEVSALPTARGWYEKRGFEQGGICSARLRAARARAFIAQLRAREKEWIAQVHLGNEE